ncbi:MAG: sulfatase-like hydrolase/transferase [Planctomycetota bacterium]
MTESEKKRPNVLFLFTDDQREDTIGALGNPHVKTPNFDKLVNSGFVFTNAYCMGGFSAAVCLPSRMMLLRGRSWFSVRQVPEDGPNFAKSLNEAGYVTYHHGKRGNADNWAHTFFTQSHYLPKEDDRTSGYPCKKLADDAIKFLREYGQKSQGERRGQPFFMYLAPANPHDPRVAAKKYMDMYDADKIPLPENFKAFHPIDNGEMFIRDERLAAWPRTDKAIREHIRDYYAVITAMDEQFGRIVKALKEIGEYDNTIIIFSSDQGIAIGSHGLMGKQNLYEHSMGVPLIFSGPGIGAGKSSDAFCYLFDVYPTVCELAGAEIPESPEGKSLAPVIRGKADSVRDTIFLAYRDVQRAVRRGRWKLIRYPKVNVTQLFDLQADPHETKNLAGEAACGEKLKELTAMLAEQQKLFGDTQRLSTASPTPAEVDLEFFKKAPPPRRRPPKAKKKAEQK